jgi:hypothetical protein
LAYKDELFLLTRVWLTASRILAGPLQKLISLDAKHLILPPARFPSNSANIHRLMRRSETEELPLLAT